MSVDLRELLHGLERTAPAGSLDVDRIAPRVRRARRRRVAAQAVGAGAALCLAAAVAVNLQPQAPRLLPATPTAPLTCGAQVGAASEGDVTMSVMAAQGASGVDYNVDLTTVLRNGGPAPLREAAGTPELYLVDEAGRVVAITHVSVEAPIEVAPGSAHLTTTGLLLADCADPTGLAVIPDGSYEVWALTTVEAGTGTQVAFGGGAPVEVRDGVVPDACGAPPPAPSGADEAQEAEVGLEVDARREVQVDLRWPGAQPDDSWVTHTQVLLTETGSDVVVAVGDPYVATVDGPGGETWVLEAPTRDCRSDRVLGVGTYQAVVVLTTEQVAGAAQGAARVRQVYAAGVVAVGGDRS